MTNKETMKMALETLEEVQMTIATSNWLNKRVEILRTALAQPEPVDMETMAASVHNAYLTTCDALGWGVKPENRVPYSELTEDSKELDRASVRAVLRYTAPPQSKEWVGLTDEEIESIYDDCDNWGKFEYERKLEAKLKEKNT